ncbi:ABC transporter substrate-binding protein [Kordiimonas sp.]|uniref:ABC transporter substrate-binding protein n=1 Tax=Kordiimonas sp. TaxID=1970157 RepID=UPI003A94973F
MNRSRALLKTLKWPIRAIWCSLAMLLPSPTLFADVIVVDSFKHDLSIQIAGGISRSCPACGTIKYMDMHRDPAVGVEIIKDLRARKANGTLELVIALGPQAATLIAEGLPDTPTLYSVHDEPDSELIKNTRFTFFDPRPPLSLQLEVLAALKPDIKTVGIIARRETLEPIRENLVSAAQSQHINLRVYYVEEPQDVSAGLRQAISESDGLIFLRDRMVLNSDTVRYILRLTLENRIPTFAYSSSLVDMGMTVTLRADPLKLGGRIGEASQARLTGSAPDPASGDDIFILEINKRTLRHIPGAAAPSGREVVFK